MKQLHIPLLLLYILGFVGLSVQGPTDVRVSLQQLNVGSMTRDIRWINSKVILAIAMRENPPTLYRSDNGGATWESQTSKLIVPPVTSASYPQFIYQNTVNRSQVYIRSNSDVSWVTHDAGVTWQSINPGFGYVNLEWHPTKPDWAIAVKVNSGAYPMVSVTQDYGSTWKPVGEIPAGATYSWGDAGTGDVPATRIYLIAPPSVPSSNHPDFVSTDDFGATREIIHDKVYDFAFMERQILILVYVPGIDDIILRVTPDIGDIHRQWFTAEFPFGEDLPINGYAILDDHTGAVYLGLNHQGRDTHYGNVYVSDSWGVHYFPSQSYVSTYQPLYDFERIRAIDGVYLANTLDNWQETHSTRDDDEIQTFVTMDNGNTWALLDPPHFDSKGVPITCTGSCALHLHCYVGYVTNLFGPIYSVESAPGFIIGNGNVGDFLTQQRQEVNTYMSRDGGITWMELMKGPTIYEIGDHGCIIVMARIGESTNVVYYTLDQGKTVRNVTLSNSPIDVYNIIAEPSSTGEHFLLQGYQGNSPVLVALDFSNVYDGKTCGSADYEEWAPGRTNIDGMNCQLGLDVVYQRRKQDANCFNNEEVNQIKSTKYCKCTWDDWECDLGFHRNGTKCLAEAEVPTGPPASCHPGETYNVTQGYRPVPGTQCQGGVQLWGEGPYDCPGSPTSSKAWIAAAVLVPLIIVILIIVGAFFAMRSEKLREKLPFLNRFKSAGYFGLNTKPDTFDEDEDIFERRTDVETHTIEEDEDQILPVSAPPALDNFDPRA